MPLMVEEKISELEDTQQHKLRKLKTKETKNWGKNNRIFQELCDNEKRWNTHVMGTPQERKREGKKQYLRQS